MDKPLVWLGNSKKTVRRFPVQTRQEAGYQLYRLQQGLSPNDFKPMQTIGVGTFEIRLHRPHEHRIIYVAKFQEAIYVLHAFEKKTQKTAKKEIAIAKDAYQEMVARRKSYEG